MSDASYLELLRELVERESPTRDVARVHELASFLAAELGRRHLGVERQEEDGFGVHLVGRLPPADGAKEAKSSKAAAAKGAEGGRDRPLLVVTHFDTVHPAGTLNRLPFAADERFVHGPGVYDMKGGIAVALAALDRLEAAGKRPRGGITFLATCDEEVGSPSSRALIEELAAESRAALVLEPSAPGGAAKTRRKGMVDFRLAVHGRAAHAGIEPEAGASAIHELAHQIIRIMALADADAGTTVNVGVIRGGTTGNVVADEAAASVDVRVWSREEAERIDAAMRALEPVDPRCSLTVEGGVNRHALERTPQNARLYERARSEAEALGFELAEAATGGASDGNFTSAAGCPTLDGLGPDGAGAHTLEERIVREDIPRRVGLLERLFLEL